MFDPISLGLGALSFGGSLLSGMGAKQASAKQARLQAIADANAAQANFETLQRVNAIRTQLGEKLIAASDPKVAVAEAEAAGFNPVTWLSAGYGARVGALSDAYRLQVPEYSLVQASQVPQQHSMLSAFGGALSAGTNMLATQYRANQSYDLQMTRMAMGLSAAGNTLGSLGGTRASGISYGGGVSTGGATSSGGGMSSATSLLPYPQNWKTGDVEKTNPWYGLKVDPTFSDAETGEKRYGDVMQEVFGFRNFVADMWLNGTGTPIGVSWNNAWTGADKPKDWASTPAGRVWEWMRSGKGMDKPITPYVPFSGGGAGVTQAW